MSWFTESNRYKHFLYAIPIGFFLTIFCVIGCAFGLEYGDYKNGGKFDWIDLISTVLGGVVGQILQILLFNLVL